MFIKKILLFVCALVLFIMFGCTKKVSNNYVISEESCQKNWAVCTLFPEHVIKIAGSKTVKVAVLDTGINQDIKGLKGQVKKSYNALNNTFETEAILDHGTMIASIIASTKSKNNVVGINPAVELYDVQVLNEKGSGKIADIISGINWSVEQGVDIINLSFGFSKDDPKLREAIRNASNKGIIIIAATGNTIGLSTDYPAKYPEVLSISAIDKDMKLYAYAGQGKVDFVAPGVDVPVLNIHGEVEMQSGTSYATAYITGIVSILLQNGSKDIEKDLRFGAIKLGAKEKFGMGLVQIKE
ncbi:S8 family serine peptidase [Bacillus wiedmannii]|uniref:S8 family serine peptidase n=1 Tax=Bacillus wiedmannii TaxID=1890302 RepID=UPI000BFB2939|nr:S8 family serine peptidase [Bacillus wiedmannii]PHD20203.1 chromosome partitioning protein ParA [Bacillus wiedmannii]